MNKKAFLALFTIFSFVFPLHSGEGEILSHLNPELVKNYWGNKISICHAHDRIEQLRQHMGEKDTSDDEMKKYRIGRLRAFILQKSLALGKCKMEIGSYLPDLTKAEQDFWIKEARLG